MLARVFKSAHSYDEWLKQPDSDRSTKSVSLVIPVLNEEATLPSLFDHLKSLDPLPAEVIFIDGGSTDRCARRFAKVLVPHRKSVPKHPLLM